MENLRKTLRMAIFAILGVAIIVQIMTTWHNGLSIFLETLFVLYVITYFTILTGSRAVNFFLASEKGEQVGILLSNGQPTTMHVFSDHYHANGWEILPGKDTIEYLPELIVKNARWIGVNWQNEMLPVSFTLKEFTKIGDGVDSKLVRRKKECLFLDGRVDLFHSHAYITEELEIKDNFHIVEYFYLKFRFTNLYEAIFKTDYFVHNMEAIVLDCAREVSVEKSVDDLRETKKQELADAIRILANDRLEDYGIEIVDVQFIDFDQTRAEEQEAQKAPGMAKLEAEALITKTNAEAEAHVLRETAKATGIRLVKKAKVDMEVAQVRRVRIASKGSASFVYAYALTKNKGLKAIGNGVMPVMSIDDVEDTKTTEK